MAAGILCLQFSLLDRRSTVYSLHISNLHKAWGVYLGQIFVRSKLNWQKRAWKLSFSRGQELFFLVHFCFASNAGHEQFLGRGQVLHQFEHFLKKKRTEIILNVRPCCLLIKHPGTSKLETGQRYSSNRMWKSNLKILEHHLFVPDRFELKLEKIHFQYVPISNHLDEFLR